MKSVKTNVSAFFFISFSSQVPSKIQDFSICKKNLSHLQHSLIISKFRLHVAIFSATHQVNVSTITKRRYSIKM